VWSYLLSFDVDNGYEIKESERVDWQSPHIISKPLNGIFMSILLCKYKNSPYAFSCLKQESSENFKSACYFSYDS